MAAIQRALAEVDHNLTMSYENSDPVRYFAGPRREIATELYEICDKLTLIQPLPARLRRPYAGSCLDMADYRVDDGEPADIALELKAERLWDQLLRESPEDNSVRGMLVLARRHLADALEDRGRIVEAWSWRNRSLAPARGKPGLFYQVATVYALNAWFVGKSPTNLSPAQLDVRRARLTKHGNSMLREAVADGFRDPVRLRSDPDLGPLRSSPEFPALILDLEFPADPFAPP